MGNPIFAKCAYHPSSFIRVYFSLVPQLSQNFRLGTVEVHFGHRTRDGGYKERPQCPQNLKSSAFLPLQLKQTITVLTILLDGAIA